jgi:hypothetical protein
VVWPEARQLIDWLLSAIAAHRPQTWTSVLNHPFLSEHSAFEQQVLDSLGRIEGKLDDVLSGLEVRPADVAEGAVGQHRSAESDGCPRHTVRWCGRRS